MADLTYSAEEAAEALGISRNAVYDLVHRAGFPAFRIGGKWKIPKVSLAQWVEREASKGGAEALGPQLGPAEHEKNRPRF